MSKFFCNGADAECACPILCADCSSADWTGGTEIKTNADHIRSMTDEELAKRLADAWDCHECSEHERIGDHPLLKSEPCDQECERHCLDWLKRRAEEDT